jgi:hypothetical protein
MPARTRRGDMERPGRDASSLRGPWPGDDFPCRTRGSCRAGASACNRFGRQRPAGVAVCRTAHRGGTRRRPRPSRLSSGLAVSGTRHAGGGEPWGKRAPMPGSIRARVDALQVAEPCRDPRTVRDAGRRTVGPNTSVPRGSSATSAVSAYPSNAACRCRSSSAPAGDTIAELTSPDPPTPVRSRTGGASRSAREHVLARPRPRT